MNLSPLPVMDVGVCVTALAVSDDDNDALTSALVLIAIKGLLQEFRSDACLALVV